MNTGQMMLSVGAIVLLGATILTLNRSSLQNGTMLQQTQIGLYAVSFAVSTIEEASGKAFDQNTYNNAVGLTSSLSSTMGPEAGETTTPVSSIKFNDFDDYNGMNRIDTVAGVDIFHTKCQVYYVTDLLHPDLVSASNTWYKKMDVKVYNSGLADSVMKNFGVNIDTVKMSYVFSYFFFR
jgi:hypothetical protein